MSEMSDAEEDASFSMSDVAVRESLTHLKSNKTINVSVLLKSEY